MRRNRELVIFYKLPVDGRVIQTLSLLKKLFCR